MKRILASVLAFTLLLLLCPAVFAAESKPDIAGYYEMTRAYDDTEEKMSQDTIDFMKDLGFEFSLNITENNTGILTYLNETQRLDFDPGKMVYTVDKKTVPFSIDGDVLTLPLGDLQCEFTRAEKPEGSGLEEDAADDAIELFIGSNHYHAGLWKVPVMEPVEAVTNCTGFTLCFRYDRVDSGMLGEQRVYVCINLKNSAWVDCGRMTVSQEGEVTRFDVTLSKPRNIEGIAVLPVTASEIPFTSSGWIENIH